MATRDEVRIDDEKTSLGGLVSRMTGDLGTLVRKEIELAKVETKEEVTRAAKGASKFGAAALTGYLCLLFVSLAAALLLDEVMPAPLAFFIVAAIYGVAATVLALNGKKQIKELQTLPETKETLQEDAQWVKTLKN